ncbi:hypothetical protein PVAP13_6NG081100 [Panicum virgatum]|uniref:Double-strand break repair protein n=1 Tax=Panicum virgatum TaxID=38727 RepID=A0A8T0QVS7_PANVG|nr:hypothetical protein PVAP13_6NG081100 [Panicum virgatum]
MEEEGGSSTLRVLVATDCHLGYLDKDEERRFDSFDTFEEICSLAEKHKVDFLLLGGDLFHENKPSNSTLVKTIEILRRYCMNDRPVQFQVLSYQAASLQNRFGQVNYEDSNYNIGLPVFAIHGSHDGPTGVDNMSSNDILSAGNFLNYFGKTDLGCTGISKTTVYPVFIRKGKTYVALYGVGNIKDERLNRMLNEPHAVNWMLPEIRDEIDWFNILVLHQKRKKASPSSGVSERLLPRFLDLVIWGHEHECLIDPEEVSGMGFHVTQPGSSIATSLINAEAKPKHVLLLEIKGTQYRSTKIPLQSVRPFEYVEVDVDPSDEATIHAYLHKIVSNLIEKVRETTASGSELKLPLVRIKVDYSGFSIINSKQFGQKYVGKVANPQDILHFTKSGERCKNTQESTNSFGEVDTNDLNKQTIEALIPETNLQLEILHLNDLNSALHEFVNNDDSMAFHSYLKQSIDEAREPGKKPITKGRQGSQNLLTGALSVLESDDEPIESSDPEESGSSQQTGRKRRAAPGGGDGGSAASAAGRRKTDLASFQRAPKKEDDADASKERRTPVAPGRYGAVIRRRG